MILTQEELQDKWFQFVNMVTAAEEIVEEIVSGDISTPDEAMDKLFDLYDRDVVKKATLENTPHETANNVYKSKKKRQEYLVISDLHMPFQVKELDKIIDMCGNRGMHLIIAGDALDCFDISVFPKSKAVGLANEVNLFKEFLRKCSLKFGEIYLVGGNHEARHSTYLRKRLSPEISSLIGDDILENIVNSLKLPNLHYTSGDTLNWYVQIDNVVIAHPSSYKRSILGTVQDTFNYFDARGTDATVFLIGHCFSSDTELLTKFGWKRHEDLNINDMVATLNKESKEIEFNKINAKYVYSTYNELYHFKNDSMDHLVTDEHGMIYETRAGKLKELQAKDFGCQEGFVYVSGIEKRDDVSGWTDDELRLLVQLHTDGCKEKDKYWRFHLNKERKINRLTSLLDRMNINYTKIKSIKYNTTKIYIGIIDNKYTKLLPDDFKSLSKRQVDIVLDEWSVTDGTRYSDKRFQLCTKLEDVANLLQALCATSGHKSNLYKKADNTFCINVRLNITKTKITNGLYNNGIIPYAGDVFCVNVDNGTLLARRNGKILVTQNTHHMGISIYKNRVIGELGCLCVEQDYSLSGNIAYSPATNGYCIFISNNNNVTFNDIMLVQV